MLSSRIEVRLPPWTREFRQSPSDPTDTVEQRMSLVLDLARQHVREATGGPFAAAVFDTDCGELISVGLNLVLPSGLSVAHAEIVAISLAQDVLGSHDLAAVSRPRLELVSSAEPCCMCFGAIHWSGVRSLVCAARDEDVRAIGFDEGPKPADWAAYLEKRGISVRRDVLRSGAADVLRQYRQAGGRIYNPSP